MASTLLNLTTILSLASIFIFLFLSQSASSYHIIANGDHTKDHIIETTSGTFFPTSTSSRKSRSLFLKKIVKKGARCHPITNNICNGILENNGTTLLYCCKNHCRNILADKNNCGRCGHKCKHGMLCCHGSCTNVAYNATHCGKCDHSCSPGIKCEFGSCGYA
ncbi:hypothetical protein Nepgr_007478 [Nepenthes gracilis]|uniref:Protein GRIM REAPER-like n=1 Tax=Nepenthes gracilis TaxID=150966 RepID=A0AAD3XIC5_NEPGR|nr:hypothetical protein Nepgr_007478 [Nepenthes gracilis]